VFGWLVGGRNHRDFGPFSHGVQAIALEIECKFLCISAKSFVVESFFGPKSRETAVFLRNFG
jgi:hypothetical protein